MDTMSDCIEITFSCCINLKFRRNTRSTRFLFSLYFMLGNYELTCIVTIKITSVTTVAKSFYFVIYQIQVTSNK